MSSNKRVKIYRDQNNEWRWTSWKSSDRVATSGEGLTQRSHVLEQVASLFPEADGWVYEVVGEGE